MPQEVTCVVVHTMYLQIVVLARAVQGDTVMSVSGSLDMAACFPVQASDADGQVSQSSVGHRSQIAWPVNEVPTNISIRCAKLQCGSKRSTSAI